MPSSALAIGRIGVLLVAPLVLFGGASLAAARAPNVVLILADDLDWADTTLYGHTRLYRTPNIQRLAARGVTFTRAYSASPLCSPTRSAATQNASVNDQAVATAA
ncbi:Arylsulfatase precursor [Pirellulimonas nuda]|uniref:Arylsulfatase n=1 Tax=Pirellulimonas nuda TaxID=2528009 RepID=A0A518D719_9BACT|nr:sulfatase-like hydrolase/transferase [Pirellulimonas nuda]QDU87239.1 Arylsulfatase precursor [Pirellulimonas nuda]